MNYTDKIREMSDEEFREEFDDLLSVIRNGDESVYVSIEVNQGELKTGWGQNKFDGAHIEISSDSFMGCDELRRRLSE